MMTFCKTGDTQWNLHSPKIDFLHCLLVGYSFGSVLDEDRFILRDKNRPRVKSSLIYHTTFFELFSVLSHCITVSLLFLN